MELTWNHLVSLVLYISAVNEIRLPLVTCQDEDSTQCMPKTAFLALLRHPDVSSSLAAYSRTARVQDDGTGRDDMAHLRALTEVADDTEICVPGRVYLQLLKDPIVRGDLSIILNGRGQKLPYLLARLYDESDTETYQSEDQKRSLATLAKNDDLPITIRDRVAENAGNGDMEALLPSDEPGQNAADARDYLIPSSDRSDLAAFAEDFSTGKRNVGTLARDFALPPGRRNIASLVRDYDQSRGNRDRVAPFSGKRNVASLARTFALPQSVKRNVASVARDYGLPYGKRYVGSLARAVDEEFPARDPRSVSSLARNSAWPITSKRGISLPGSVLLRALSRHGRSITDEPYTGDELLALQELHGLQSVHGKDSELGDTSPAETEPNNRRPKRQIVFSDEYPLPVLQNTNAFDYEELMEALGEQYPNTEKRFMETGSAPAMHQRVDHFDYPETIRADKRHIGALARLGWLPSLRAARFSRSPRYLIRRENPANGAPTDYTTNSSTRSLRPNFNPRTRYVQALHEDCQHGSKRFPLLSTTDNYFHQKLPRSMRSKTFKTIYQQKLYN